MELLRKFEKEHFAGWVGKIEEYMSQSDSPLSLQKTGRLMELDYGDGHLKVNFSDELITLIREVRQLSALGFPVPSKIHSLATSAQKFYRYGVILKQVANFHNTIDQQMLPCQQAMLLDSALAFEEVVTSVKHNAKEKNQEIIWDNATQLEGFISRLQNAAERLTSQNRKLRKYHVDICDRVVSLMGTDLIKQPNTWKDELAELRKIFQSVEAQGYPAESMITWRNHWDYQLYKALEHQFQLGLESLNENLPSIKVDLIFKQQKLQFRPPFEEVRAKYYRELKKFINIPTMFKGVGDGKIYSQMLDRNSEALFVVYKKAEILFQNLYKVQDIFKEWILIGTVDLDNFLSQALNEVYDWEFNFKMLKSKGKEVESLPSVVKVDCITVSTVPVKNTIDDHLQQLFDAMMNSLAQSANQHLQAIDQFVKEGMEILSRRPQSIDEISEANARHKELSEKRNQMQYHLEAAEQKNKLLKSVAGTGVEFAQVQGRWDKFDLMFESHELMIKEQVDHLKAAMDSRILNLNTDIGKFASRWQQLKPKVSDLEDAALVKKAVDFIRERRVEFNEIEKNASAIQEDCKRFNMPELIVPEMEDLKRDLQESEGTWDLYNNFISEFEEYNKEDWISFRNRTSLFENLLQKWSDKLKERDIDQISAYIQAKLDEFHEVLPCFRYIKGDIWTPEHWMEFFRLVSIPLSTKLAELTFGQILKVARNIIQSMKKIKDINERARGEATIREALQELDLWGAKSVFSLSDYVDTKNRQLSLIKDWKETITQIGDNQSLLQSLKDSPFFKAFADKATIWESRLADLDEYLRNLNTVQRKWVYLEPIFSRGALPAEQSRFDRVDEEFYAIMMSIQRDNRVVSIVSYPGIRDILVTLVDQLERCQKALSEFMEEKRSKFARFYFLGDEDLLEILGQAKNPSVIQSHLKKLFAGINKVEFDEKKTKITAVKSAEGEVVQLKHPVQITEEVEIWLQSLSEEMVSTLSKLLVECLAVNDIFKYPQQILDLSETLHFTANCEKAILDGSLANLLVSLKKQLATYTSFDINKVEDKQTRHIVLFRIKSLILDVIHNISVVEYLIKENTRTLEEWSWQKQLRFYMGEDNICRIRMCDAEFIYTYEYQGNLSKLVHTPLTDKCFLTLTQAMANGYGGNPFGPAGTGKTESVKALGALFGRQVLVFNCDEGLDYKSMGRIFIGLVKCGAWGCFDEFNRLEEAVLSAVSQQIQLIQGALKSSSQNVSLLGKIVDLSPSSAIFITLNPAGKGYGGRQKLPDNLKQLFRQIAMTIPDNELIAEVILLSEGFEQGNTLGCKIVSLFNLCKQLLSTQQHYDWGLRALKTVLRVAGNLLQMKKRSGVAITQKDEVNIVCQALRSNTLSKLTFGDSKRFDSLLNDVFPNVSQSNITYDELIEAIKWAYGELKLEYVEEQVAKVIQFYEACRTRMGVVIVGSPGVGKSTIWQVLKLAWQKVGQHLVLHTMNPKAIDRHSLLGHMDMDTREWYDGILTVAARKAVKEPNETHSWIICDGDIDPEWIESLNSVLDDNRLLTIPSGERIQFGANVNFIFETHDLKYASPATVSRMGMIYLFPELLDTQTIVKNWLRRQEGESKELKKLVDEFFYPCLIWIDQNSTNVVDTTRMGTVSNGLSLLSGSKSKPEFICNLIKGFGSNMPFEARTAFASEVFKWAKLVPLDVKKPLDTYFNAKTGQLASYQFQVFDSVDVSKIKDSDNLAVVETVDVQRNTDIIVPWILGGNNILLVGPEGAGKNMILRHCFSKVASTHVAVVYCSAQTKPSQILQRLNQYCISLSTNTGRTIRPKDCERLIVYIKDINLPKPDKYETVQLISFLHQMITYKGYYDANLEWISIENIQIVASMNPASTMGRFALTTRFTSICKILCISYTDLEQLRGLYGALMYPIVQQCYTSHKIWNLPKNVQQLASTMINIFDQTRTRFTNDQFSHYVFTPRDVSKWAVNLARYAYSKDNADELLDVVAYEAIRLFQDRLVGDDNRQKFQGILLSVLKIDWGYQPDLNSILFASQKAMGQAVNIDQGNMINRVTLSEYHSQVSKSLNSYSREFKDMNIFLFPEALDGIARIERVLSQKGGSLLLAGRNGMGRRSAVILIAHMLGFHFFSPQVSRQYNIKSFQNDLKQIFNTCGVNKEECVLLMEDHQILDSSFLEYINSILSAGEVPELYSNDELEQIFHNLKNEYNEEGFRGSLFEFFLYRIKRNLHVVLIMDCSSSSFISNCESNPAFYTRCQVEWMESWTPSTLIELAKNILTKEPALANLKILEKIIKGMVGIHGTCSAMRPNPRHYVRYVETYATLYKDKLQMLHSKQKRLQSGLSKLTEASQFVDKLSVEANKQKALLAEKQEDADRALKQITDSMVKQSEQKNEMLTLTASLKQEEGSIINRKSVIEKELSEVEPLLRSAKEAVGEIKSEHLSEIRALRAPPPVIRDVLEGVLRLMGIFDTSWTSMKAFLGKRTIKEEILNFDARNISRDIRDSMNGFLSEKATSFDENVVKRSSVAAAPLAAWVKANVQYSIVLEKIQPLESDLNRLAQSLEGSRTRLAKLQQALLQVDETVAKLKDEFGIKTRDAEVLKADLEKTTKTIYSAQNLLGKLDGEKTRWSNQASEINSSIESLPRDTLLSAGFVNYLSGSAEEVRKGLLGGWKNSTGAKTFEVREALSSESEQLVWKSEGLPSDSLSAENAIVIMKSLAFPLIIDPSNRVVNWLQQHLKDSKLEVIQQSSPNFVRSLELAVRFGKTLVVREVEYIEPLLYPLLRKDMTKQGPRNIVTVGEKSVDYNDSFKLFLVTRNPDFQVPPDASALVTCVNFTITRTGLAGQLLGITIQHEKPQIEIEKVNLLKREEELRVELLSLEESLLKELASSEGNILENLSLINSLNDTKAKSVTITEALTESRKLQATLDTERDKYGLLSQYGSSIFFMISELKNVNNMYQFSLESYLRIFNKAFKVDNTPSDNPEARVKSLVLTLEKLVYHYVCRSIFKADRHMFAIHLIHELKPKLFQPKEWEVFLGSVVQDIDPGQQVPNWVNSDRAEAYKLLTVTE
jgi:dynein heavy chain 2